jgi:hypothetical protein
MTSRPNQASPPRAAIKRDTVVDVLTLCCARNESRCEIRPATCTTRKVMVRSTRAVTHLPPGRS